MPSENEMEINSPPIGPDTKIGTSKSRDTKLKTKIFTGKNLQEAEIVKFQLERAEFDVELRGSDLLSIRGELPISSETEPSLWVDEGSAENARSFIEELYSNSNGDAPSWICDQCQETIEGSFLTCWNCGQDKSRSPPAEAESKIPSERPIERTKAPDTWEAWEARESENFQFPFITSFICLIALATTFKSGVMSGKSWAELNSIGYFSGEDIWAEDFWKILTPMVAQPSWPVAILGVVFFAYAGFRLERYFNRLHWLVFIIVSTLVSNATVLAIFDNPGYSLLPLCYASLGPLLILQKSEKPRNIWNLMAPIGFVMGIMGLELGALVSFVDVANAGYFASFVFGIFYFLVFKKSDSIKLSFLASTLLIFSIPLYWVPWSPNWHSTRAYASIQNNDFHSAEEHFLESVKLGKNLAHIRAGMGYFYQAIGKIQASYDEYNEAVLLQSNYADAIYGRAEASKLLHQFEKAEKALKNALNHSPDAFYLYSSLGGLYLSLSEFNQSLEYYQKALLINENDYPTKIGHAHVSFYKSNSKKIDDLSRRAIEDSTIQLEKGDDKNLYFKRRGFAYFELKQYDKAKLDFEQALKINERDFIALCWLAWSHARLKNWQDAKNQFESSLAIFDKFTDALLGYGLSLAYLNEADKSEQLFAKAEKLNDRDWYLYFIWGEAYEALGRKDDALAKFKKAFELNPYHYHLQELFK